MTKAILDKYKIKVYLLLYRVYNRHILNCLLVSFKVFMTKLQIRFLNKFKDRNIVRHNKLAHIITVHFLHEDIPEDYKVIREEEGELIDSEISELSINKEFMTLASAYYRIQAFYFGWTRSCDKSEELLQKALQYDDSSTALTPSEFGELRAAIKKEYRQSRKEYRKTLGAFLSDERYKLIKRIEILPSHITFIASTTATIFLLTGYIYNKFYLGAFDIEVSNFFSLSDYITSSVDKIYIAGIATVFGVGAYLLGGYDVLMLEVNRVQFEVDFLWIHKLMFYLGFCGILFSTLYIFYYDNPNKYRILSTFFLMILIFLYHRIPIYKFIKNYTFVSVLYVAFIFFATYIFGIVATDIDRIHRYSVVELKKYDFEFNRSVPLNQATSVLLAETKENMFFYDKDSKISYVIPRSAISWIKAVQSKQ